jgi:hypothetical protein
MTVNIMEQYIEITKKQIEDYMKLVLEEKFNKTYCDLFIERYINIRYYNYYENEMAETIRRKILSHLKQVSEDMIINNINDRELIENMRVLFYYVLYFDNVVYYKNLENKIIQIAKIRMRIYGKITENFEKNLFQTMQKYINDKRKLVEKFLSNEFYLKITNYPDKLKIYRINLKFKNIKFPLEYSEFAINKAFQTGLMAEDKLVIEYYLVVLQILKDVLKLNFKRKYILEFADTLLKKPKKIKGILNIISSSAVQDKVSLKIKYEQFIQNKEIIYDLMRNGYKITIILDNSFDVTFKNIETLQMFEFVIISRDLKKYNEIKQEVKELHNIIEI